MYYPEDLIEEVRIRNDIVDVISGYIKLEKKGKNYWGLCPFHNEKTPSFSVEPAKQFYHCFGCSNGGNVIHFIMNIEKLDFIEAFKLLAERAGVNLPEPEDSREREKAVRRKEILELNREAARFFFNTLAGKNGLEAQHYLRRRNLQEKTIKQFGLGFSPDSWNDLTKYLLAKGFSRDLLLDSGLSIKAKNDELVDRFRRRVMFPIFDIRGNVIGFGGRVIDDSQPKYMNSPDTPVYNKSRELYGLNFARMSSSKRLLIVEGYMDVISLHQAGIDYAVASLGTAMTQMQAWIMKKYSDEVVIAYDSDTAGQAATLRGLDILEGAGCNVRVLQIPQGKDPDEYIRNNGPEKFKTLVERATSLLDYKIKTKKNMHNLDTLDDKLKLLNSIADTLAEHDNHIEREVYAKNYAEEYGISFESLTNEVKKRLRARQKSQDYSRSYDETRRRANAPGFKEPTDPRYGELEYMLVVMLCHDNRLFDIAEKEYDLDSFSDEGARQLAEKLYRKLKANESCVLVELLNETQPEIASYLVRISETKCEIQEPDKAIKQILNKLKVLKLEELQKQTIERIKNEQDGTKRQELGLEFSRRAEQIAELKRMA